jgi:hypothetical protein
MAAACIQQALKSAPGTARTQIVAAELLAQLDVAVRDTRPRFTRVSEGKDFRRLDVMSKAGEVVERAMLAHGTPPSKRGRMAAWMR